MSDSAASISPAASTKDSKVMTDLESLTEKMDLCDVMLLNNNPPAGDLSAAKTSSEALLAVIGFLEACAPRMVELVEAAAQGALSEDVFAQCLAINDRLQKQLADIETSASTTTTTAASTTTAAASASAPKPESKQFEDLLMQEEESSENAQQPSAAAPAATAAAPAGEKTTGEDDEDEDPFTSAKPAATPDAPAGVERSNSEDEFDDFFASRNIG
jgi:hypothetical protein